MLKDWLSEGEYAAFLDSRRHRRPHAQASIAAITGALFDWDAIERVLRQQPDCIVVRDSALLEAPAPTSAEALRALMARGTGAVVRRAQSSDREFYDIAQRFEREFARSVQVQLFVTPAATRGFGWHYDNEDVIILQTGGSKTYYMRENTRVKPDCSGDFSAIREEVSPLAACTLVAGDALYLPRGMWHMAKAHQDSFSISLGLSTSD